MNVPGKQDADKLADLLESLAAHTERDDPPHRSTPCGPQDCGLPSYIRCLYGSVEGVYFVGHDDIPPTDKGGKGVKEEGKR